MYFVHWQCWTKNALKLSRNRRPSRVENVSYKSLCSNGGGVKVTASFTLCGSLSTCKGYNQIANPVFLCLSDVLEEILTVNGFKTSIMLLCRYNQLFSSVFGSSGS